MKIKMKSGLKLNSKRTADPKQSESETARKATSAKRCNELGVTGPNDPTLIPKIQLAQLRKDFDALRSEFNAFKKDAEKERSQIAKLQSAVGPSHSRSMQRPRETTRAFRSR